MSDAQIAAALTPAPAAAPTSPAEAATRLDQLGADSAWRDKFLAGSPAENAEWQSLTALVAKGDNVDAAMAGLPVGGMGAPQPSGHLENISMAAMLREIGIRDEITRDVLAGTHQVTKEEFRATEIWKRDRMGDPEFVKKFTAGEPEAVRQLTLANIILTGGIREGKAA